MAQDQGALNRSRPPSPVHGLGTKRLPSPDTMATALVLVGEEEAVTPAAPGPSLRTRTAMAGRRPSLRRVPDLLLLVGVAGWIIGLGAVAAGLSTPERVSKPIFSATRNAHDFDPAPFTSPSGQLPCECDQPSPPAPAPGEALASVFPRGPHLGQPSAKPYQVLGRIRFGALEPNEPPLSEHDLRRDLSEAAQSARERRPSSLATVWIDRWTTVSPELTVPSRVQTRR
jgi:hypothetical protein